MSWNQFCELYKTPKDYRDVSLDPCKFMPEKRSLLGSKWIEKPSKSLILKGKTGRGKTYFLYCLLRGLVERWGLSPIKFFKSKTLDDKILENFHKFGNSSFFIEELKELPFLFIDDFGLERSGERAERDYYDLIDSRVSNRKTTVISTNLNDSDILKTFGERIHSRMKTFIGLDFEGEDIRGKLN